MFQTNVFEKITKNIVYSMKFFFLGNLAVYEVTWGNVVEPDRPQII